MTCTGGRLARFLKWKVFRPSPVMSNVLQIERWVAIMMVDALMFAVDASLAGSA